MSDTNARHFARLRELATSGLGFVTIGSAGLLLAHPSLRKTYVLNDSDVLLSDGLDGLFAFVRWAETQGAAVTCWSEAWDWRWGERELAGKLYVRAIWEGLTLDATYEESLFDAAALVRAAPWIDGIPVCPEVELWAGRLRKSADDTRRFAREHGLVIPPESFFRTARA